MALPPPAGGEPGGQQVGRAAETPAPRAIDLDRLEVILERQVEEVAYEAALAALDGVLPDTLRRFVT